MMKVTVASGEEKEALPVYRDFDLEEVLQDNADKTFYVAQDSQGKIYGSVMINDKDRKSNGASVGNWIASGLVVTRKTLRELNKASRTHEMTSAPATATTDPVAKSDPVQE